MTMKKPLETAKTKEVKYNLMVCKSMHKTLRNSVVFNVAKCLTPVEQGTLVLFCYSI